MFVYDKKLQYPVKIARPNPRLASVIISQFGGIHALPVPAVFHAL